MTDDIKQNIADLIGGTPRKKRSDAGPISSQRARMIRALNDPDWNIDYNVRCSLVLEHVDTGATMRVTCYGISMQEACSVHMGPGPQFGGMLAKRLERRGIILCGFGGPWVTSIFHVCEEPFHNDGR